jgi:hypothetical protein
MAACTQLLAELVTGTYIAIKQIHKASISANNENSNEKQ